MRETVDPRASPIVSGPGKAEFVLLAALVMMVVAFAIDSMLPAFPAIGRSLGAPSAGEQGLIISAFIIGFGVAQLFSGMLADRFGRRRIILISLAGFAVTSALAALSSSFAILLFARAVQGVFCAGARVALSAMIRDRYEGREMAQVMSLTGMLFMAAPILAPAMGQMVLSLADWRWIFGALSLIGFGLVGWMGWRMPETLHQEDRLPIAWPSVRDSARTVVTERLSLGYGLALAVMSCGMFAFLTSVQPIFDQRFGRAELLPTGFAIMALGMAVVSLLNAAIVRRYGMRLIGHAALLWFIAFAAIHTIVALTGHETLTNFIILQMVMMMGFVLVGGNFTAMAMENMGHVAGMANAIQGFVQNMIGAFFGTMIGFAFDGTTVPLYLGMTVSGLVALIIVFVTEKGKLFRAHHAPPQGV